MSKHRSVQARRANHRGYGTGVMLTLLLFLLAIGGMSWVYSGMVAHDRWPIAWLEVDGVFERVSAEQVRAVTGPVIAGSYFTVDMARVEAAVERLPWVADATAIKHWPDTVHITVLEHSPVAHWDNGNDDSLMVSSDARAFRVSGARSMQGLPWLESPPDRLQEVFTEWQRFNDVLERIGLRVERLSLNPRGAWSMQLGNGTRVALGRDHADDRLKRMVRSWPTLLATEGRAPAEVDLRYANGLAVRWPDEPEPLELPESTELTYLDR